MNEYSGRVESLIQILERNIFIITLFVVTQMRMGFLLSQAPLKVSSLCHLNKFLLVSVTSSLLIGMNLNILMKNLYPDFCKAWM